MTKVQHVKVNILDRDMYQNDPFPTLEWIRRNEPVYQDVNGIWALTKIEDKLLAKLKTAILATQWHCAAIDDR